MVLTVDNLAHRYKLLPSEVLARADTFDLHVMDVATRYLKVQRQKYENERLNPQAPPTPILSVKEMKDMIARTRSGKK